MDIEYEATYKNINKDEVRERLRNVGAQFVQPEYLQKSLIFNMPKGHEVFGGWVRVRDEGDRITMSFKVVSGDKLHDQKEINLKIDNFEEAQKFLIGIGCEQVSYQEKKRELWKLDGTEITIDEWPFLEPFVEVEGKSENEIKMVSERIGFDYSTAAFGSTDMWFREKTNNSRGIYVSCYFKRRSDY